MRAILLLLVLLLPGAALAQTSPEAHGPFDTSAGAGSAASSSPTATFTPGTYAPAGASVVTTGGTAVTALAAGSIRTGFDLQNPTTATEPLYWSLVGAAGTAASGSTFALAAGASYHGTTGTGQALSVNAATSGHVFAATSN